MAAQWQGLAHTHRSTYPFLALARLEFRDESCGSILMRTSSILGVRRWIRAHAPGHHWQDSQGFPPREARTEGATNNASSTSNRLRRFGRRDGLSGDRTGMSTASKSQSVLYSSLTAPVAILMSGSARVSAITNFHECCTKPHISDRHLVSHGTQNSSGTKVSHFLKASRKVGHFCPTTH